MCITATAPRTAFGEMMYMLAGREIKRLAEEYCQGRLLSLLEGGYQLGVLSQCVADHIKVLME